MSSVAVALSGGIDSSSIVGIMHKERIQDIKTFTIGFGEIDLNNAIDQASIVAEHFSTDHQHFTVNNCFSMSSISDFHCFTSLRLSSGSCTERHDPDMV